MKKPDFEDLRKDLSVAGYFLKLTHRISKTYIPLLLISSLFKALAPFINIVMPKFILDELMGARRPESFLLLVGIVVGGNAIFNLINRFFDAKVNIANIALINGFELHLGRHIMEMDFENLEDSEVLDKKEQAFFSIINQGAMRRLIDSIINLVQTIISLVGLIVIISTLNFVLIGIIIFIVLINARLFKKTQDVQFEFNQAIIPMNRHFGYYSDLTSDFSMGKDVRIYDMSPYILKKLDNFHSKSGDIAYKLFMILGRMEGLSNLTLQIQMIIIYSYMVWQVYISSIGLGDFTMYISAANDFSGELSFGLNQFIEFRQMCKYLDLYIQFESLPIRSRDGEKTVAGIEVESIEFRNVYFRYPRSKDYALKDVSIKINSGEKLSVVGPNGAGKTTFIKLLCRLYEPDEGEILINGVNINEYSFDEYIKLLAVVFQDYKLFSFSIRENLTFDEEGDEGKVISALKKAGVYERMEQLERGIDTSLYKNFDEKGIELSGGESQKIAIARAIYRDSPIIILDEPTAALDPYAEFEIYFKLSTLMEDRTAIYISHRLSSSLLCDKIAVFEDGEIVEYGTHLELKEAGGLYSEMWHAQAQYYAKEE